MFFGICKERTAFVLVSRQVGMYVMTGLMSDGTPIARILTVYQVLQGRRCYPHKMQFIVFRAHINRVKRKVHMRKKEEDLLKNKV